MLSPENLQPLTELPEQAYSLPAVEKPVEMFKGEKFNVMELAVQLKKSKSIDRLFENRALDNRPRQPLLPLNVSQIGLVGASGMMNGLVECDTPPCDQKGGLSKENQKPKIGGRKTTAGKNGDTGDHVQQTGFQYPDAPRIPIPGLNKNRKDLNDHEKTNQNN